MTLFIFLQNMIWRDHLFNYGQNSVTRVTKFRKNNWRGNSYPVWITQSKPRDHNFDWKCPNLRPTQFILKAKQIYSVEANSGITIGHYREGKSPFQARFLPEVFSSLWASLSSLALSSSSISAFLRPSALSGKYEYWNLNLKLEEWSVSDNITCTFFEFTSSCLSGASRAAFVAQRIRVIASTSPCFESVAPVAYRAFWPCAPISPLGRCHGCKSSL